MTPYGHLDAGNIGSGVGFLSVSYKPLLDLIGILR